MRKAAFITTVLAGLLACTVFFSSIGSDNGKELKKVLSLIEGHRVECDYSFSITENGVPVLFSGHATLQTGYFHISGNGLDIYCDGSSIHYLDREAKEAYIESAVKLEDYIASNIGNVSDLKTANVTVTPPSEDLSAFSVPSLGPEWVVTDLR